MLMYGKVSQENFVELTAAPLCRIKKYASWKPIPIMIYFLEQTDKPEIYMEVV